MNPSCDGLRWCCLKIDRLATAAFQGPVWVSTLASLIIDVWMMPVVCPCFCPTGMSESEQFLKGTSQIKILSPEDIEGMRVVCKVNKMNCHCCQYFPFIAFLVLTCLLFAAGTRSPGHCSHDGKTGCYNRGNWPCCACGKYTHTHIHGPQRIKPTDFPITVIGWIVVKFSTDIHVPTQFEL